MKRFFIKAICYQILALFILFSSSYCLNENSPYPPDIKKILDRGYLIVAMSSDERVPFFTAQKDNDDPQGVDVNLAKKIAENLGVEKVVFLRDTKNFDGVVDNVAQHKADVAISKLSFTYDRAMKVHYSKKYATLYKSLLINRVSFPAMSEEMTDSQIQSFFNKPTIIIGVMKDTSYVHFAKNLFPQAEIKTMEKWEDILEAVVKKEISAAFWDDLEIEKYLSKNTDKFLILQTIKFKQEKDTIHITTPWDSHQLSNFIELLLTTNNINYLTKDILNEGQKKDNLKDR